MTETNTAQAAPPRTPSASRPPTSPPTTRNIPGLDSVRGLAVLAVIAYHLGHVRGGFLGVDVFFVLSGFLITSLALDEVARTGELSIVAFWRRRLRRLAPAIYVLIPVVVAAALLLDWNRLVRDVLAWDAFAGLTWWENWRIAFSGGGYWSDGAPAPFRHLWSLGVEAQFYVIWPLAFVGAVQLGRRRGNVVGWVTRMAIAGIVVSAAWSVVLARRVEISDLSRVYVGTDTRLATPLIGCLLACLLRTPGGDSTRRQRELDPFLAIGIGGASLVLLGLMMATVSVDDASLYRTGLLPAVGVLGAGVILGARALPRTDPVTRWLGQRSYAIYLWSWPIQVLTRFEFPDVSRLTLAVVTIGGSFLLAELSWWLIEFPAQHRVAWATPVWGRRAAAVVAVTAAVASVSLSIRNDIDLPARLVDTASAERLNSKPPETAPPGTPGYGGLRVALFGDSVAFTLGLFTGPPGSVPGISTIDMMAIIGCPVLTRDGYLGEESAADQAGCEPQVVLEEIALERRPDVVIFQTGSWEFQSFMGPDGLRYPKQSPQLAEKIIGELVDMARRADAVGARTMFLSYACPGRRDPIVGRLDRNYLAWFESVQQQAAERARSYGFRATVLEPTEQVCVDADPAGDPTPAKDKAFNHEVHVIDETGGLWAWRTWLGPAILASQ